MTVSTGKIDHEHLYRGFNWRISLKTAVEPKSPDQPLEQGAECGDERVQCGDEDFTFGLNVGNTIHSHEYGGNGEPSPGMSTTPDFSVARKYALGTEKDNHPFGFVIKFSTQALLAAGVQIFPISRSLTSPAVPEDNEHWLYFQGDFPVETIVEVTSVFR